MTAWIAVATGAAAVLFAAAAALLARRSNALQAELRQVRSGRREVAGSLDLDDVVARILDGALALPRVDAAVLSLAGDEKGTLVKSAGMTQAEAERQGELGSTVSVALEGELGPLGTLTVYSGSDPRGRGRGGGGGPRGKPSVRASSDRPCRSPWRESSDRLARSRSTPARTGGSASGSGTGSRKARGGAGRGSTTVARPT